MLRFCLFHLLKGDGVLLGAADATPNGSVYHNRFVFALAGAIGVDDVGHLLCVGFADGTTAKAAGCVCGAFTVPTFHMGILD